MWAATRDQKLAYVLHPRWCTGTRQIKLLCITDGCCTVLALNGLNKHLASHHRNNSCRVHPLEKHDFGITQQEEAQDNKGPQPEAIESMEPDSMEPDLKQPGVLEEDKDVRDGPSDSSSSEDGDGA